MISLIRHQDKRVQRCAVDCLIQLHDPTIIQHWGPATHLIQNFWRISSHTVLFISRQILDNRMNEDTLKQLLELLSKILLSRNAFLTQIMVKKKKKNSSCYQTSQQNVFLY